MPFYSFDKVAHFILLGLLWSGTWLCLAMAGHRHVSTGAAQAPAPAMDGPGSAGD